MPVLLKTVSTYFLTRLSGKTANTVTFRYVYRLAL